MDVISYKKEYYAELVGLIYEFNEYIKSIDTMGLVQSFKSKEETRLYTDKSIKDAEEMAGLLYLAVDNDEVIGFIQGVVVQKGSDLFDKLTHDNDLEGWIGELFVKESYRGKGAGRKLYSGAQSYFEAKGCKYIRLLVLNDNKSAVKTYEKLGFQIRGLNMIRPTKY